MISKTLHQLLAGTRFVLEGFRVTSERHRQRFLHAEVAQLLTFHECAEINIRLATIHRHCAALIERMKEIEDSKKEN